MLLALLLVGQANAQKSLFDLSAGNLFNEDKEFVDVEQAFQFDFDQTKQQVIVKFNIKDGYYLYRHQFKFPVNNAKIAPVELPKGSITKMNFLACSKFISTNYLSPLTFYKQVITPV